MAVKLFHQCGHNTTWNIDSLAKDGCGDGLILSPVHRQFRDIEKIDKAVRLRSIFDPQFYLPNSQKNKLKSYPFFPETISSDNFSTSDFTLVAYEAAKLCVEFQLENRFSHITIPGRYFDQMYPDFIDRQNSYTVHPFLKALVHKKIKKPVYLTLPLTAHMIINKAFRTQILNWATSFPEITGVYVIASPYDESTKQIQSHEFLLSYMEFLYQLRQADLEVLIGYCNAEAILYLMIEGCDITFGTFENTRMFSIDKFVISEEERRGPKARIFSTGLLNWIQLSQAKEIMKDDPGIWKQIYDQTEYGDRALRAAVEPTFNQPLLYKHHFIVFSKLVSRLKGLSILERYKELRSHLKNASALYSEISDLPIDLEKHSRGSHIEAWLTALNGFYRSHIKSKES
jgi:hypothetical protein